jgi:hypothetical protein
MEYSDSDNAGRSFGWEANDPPEPEQPEQAGFDTSGQDPFGLRTPADPYKRIDPAFLRPVGDSAREPRVLDDEATFRRTQDFADILSGSAGERDLMRASLVDVAALFSEQFPAVDQESLETYVDLDGGLFASGLPDTDAKTASIVASDRKATLARMMEDKRKFEANEFGPDASRRAAVRAGDKRLSLEQMLRTPERQQWARTVEEQSGRGFFRSPVLGLPFMQMNFIYAPEMPPMAAAPNVEIVTLGMSVADRELLFPGRFISSRQPVSFVDVAQALRERGGVDLSKETLDARIEALSAMAYVETAGLALHDLTDLAQLGGARTQKAVELYKRHGDHLLENSSTATGDLLGEIATYTADLAQTMNTHQNPIARRLLMTMSHRSQQLADHLYQAGPSLRHIYDTFGWPHPPQLALPPAETVDQPAAEPDSAPAPEVADESPRSDVQPEAVTTGGLAGQVAKEQLRRAVFNQLDEIILPSEANGITGEEFAERLREAADMMARETPGGSADVMWPRLSDLVTLSREYGGTLYKSKKGTLGGALPYFVCVFEYEGDTVAVAETPISENATYVVAEGKAAGSWLEVLTLRRDDARQVGAARKYHTKSAPHGERHLQKIRDLIDELVLT